jgi:hypothetical protein
MTVIKGTVTPESLLPAPCPWWRRVWLKLRRKPLPTIAPPGTQAVTFDLKQDDGTVVRYHFPAARVQWQDLGTIDDDTPVPFPSQSTRVDYWK